MSNLYQFPLEYCLTPYGPVVYLPQDTFVGKSIHATGWYSPSEVKLLCNILAKGCGSFWNVGSNIGYISVAMKAHHPLMQVTAVEAQPVMAQLTAMNLARFTGADVHNIALGAENGEVQVPTFNYAITNNFGAIGRPQWTEGTTVKLRRLDAFRVQPVDLLHLDVEGMELDVLRGAAETLASQKPTLFLECDRPAEGRALLTALEEEFDYDTYWAVTPLFEEPNPAGAEENPFPNVAAFNLVGIPRDRLVREGEAWVQENLTKASPDDEIGRSDKLLVLR